MERITGIFSEGKAKVLKATNAFAKKIKLLIHAAGE
jgi:hypothetical protein